ncbi:MAG: amino acid ABC transporter permease [Alphaproteobacteria bacterium]|nr:amino acid ABC transporter permease [Alphaproteobacteria bacterium]
MAEIAHGGTAAPAIRPPVIEIGVLGWMRKNLFGSVPSTLLTIVAAYMIVITVPGIIDWAFLRAVWVSDTSAACKAPGAGACWAFIADKHRLIFFGTYPYAEQWRPLIATAILLAMIVGSCDRRLWNRWLLAWWAGGLVVCSVLMWGGVLRLTYVSNLDWGGLPLTLVLSVVGCVFAFPLGMVLALGRRSHMPIIRWLSVGYIELIRGVPLITVLITASVIFPLFLPAGVNIDKLLRAQVGIILFEAAYIAEIVRGGLQAVPRGQHEAADSLGLSYFNKQRMIVLPQALRMVIPPLVGNFIGLFKSTTLVIVIGLFDLLNSAKAALTDLNWRGFSIELYIFTAAIYFIFCYSMSKYSQALERDLNKGTRR